VGIDHMLPLDEAQTPARANGVISNAGRMSILIAATGPRKKKTHACYVFVGDKNKSIYSFQAPTRLNRPQTRNLFEQKINPYGQTFQRRSLE